MQEKASNRCTLWPASLATSPSCRELLGLSPCPPFRVGTTLLLLSLERGPGHPSTQARGTLRSCQRRTPDFGENSLEVVTDNSCSLLLPEPQSMSIGPFQPSETGRNNRVCIPMEKRCLQTLSACSWLSPTCLIAIGGRVALWEGFHTQSITWRKDTELPDPHPSTACALEGRRHVSLKAPTTCFSPWKEGMGLPRSRAWPQTPDWGRDFHPGTMLSWKHSLNPANPLWPGATS